MDIYTIGFTRKSAADFFGKLRQAGIKRLIDIRLHNVSQLAGFSKRNDLAFFVRELCGAEYVHEPLLAPTPALFDGLKKLKGSWQEYERGFLDLMAQRKIEERLGRDFFTGPAVLLCSEPTADHCHRRLILEHLQRPWNDLHAIHL
jgi:uncharacterized protein (DUF488 family)